jgi:hypothetical protein
VSSGAAPGAVSTVAIDGKFDIKSGGSGFVKTKEGGAEGSGASGVSGTSSGGIAESQIGIIAGVFPSSLAGEIIFKGSSATNSEGSFVAGYSPDQSVNPTGGTGSGSGSAGVKKSSAFLMGATVGPGVVAAGASVSQSGAAEIFGGGSSTGFNNLASAGGLGSGLAAVKSNGLNDAVGPVPANTPAATDILTSNQVTSSYCNLQRRCVLRYQRKVHESALYRWNRNWQWEGQRHICRGRIIGWCGPLFIWRCGWRRRL